MEGGSSALLGAADRLNKAAPTFGCLTHDWFVLRLAEVLPKRLVLLLVVPFTYKGGQARSDREKHSPDE